jgi:hypothetical protein
MQYPGHTKDQVKAPIISYPRRSEAAVRPHVGASKTITEPVALQLIALHDDAAARAKQLAERHRLNGSTPGSNPSSTVWRLIDDLRVW